jgi:hypothetical protein
MPFDPHPEQPAPTGGASSAPEEERDASVRSSLSRRSFLGASVAATVAVGATVQGLGSTASAQAAPLPSASAVVDPDALSWLVFDHHVHSVYSHDAKYPMTTILDQAQRFAVDAIAFTEHSNKGHANVGGVFNAAREIDTARAARPDMLVLQGLEWYIPGAEHATVLIAPGPRTTLVLRRFELDHDGKLNGWEKPRPGTDDAAEWLVHATDGIAWLGAQKRAGIIDDVIVLANHPSRLGIDSPGELRAWQDADPEVFVGMEGAPGAQAGAIAANATERSRRGEYENTPSEFSFPGYPAEAYLTHGGFDWTTAVVGGVWDSLLSEGRRWWITTNSDLHLKESDATRVGDFPTGPGWEAGATLANFNRRSSAQPDRHGHAPERRRLLAGRVQPDARRGRRPVVRLPARRDPRRPCLGRPRAPRRRTLRRTPCHRPAGDRRHLGRYPHRHKRHRPRARGRRHAHDDAHLAGHDAETRAPRPDPRARHRTRRRP